MSALLRELPAFALVHRIGMIENFDDGHTPFIEKGCTGCRSCKTCKGCTASASDEGSVGGAERRDNQGIPSGPVKF